VFDENEYTADSQHVYVMVY